MDTTISKRRRKAKPTLGPYKEGGYKWAVYFVGDDGKRARRKFVTKNEASTFLADKLVEAENLGTRISSALDDDIKRDAFDAIELLNPFGKSLLDAARHFRAHLEATAKSAHIASLIEPFVESKEADGKCRSYLTDLRYRMVRFAKVHGDRFASEITTKEIQEWLAGLTTVGPLSRNHFRRVLGTFFTWCWRLGYCAENPVAKVSKAKCAPSLISILSPKEMADLLRSAATWNPDRIRPMNPDAHYNLNRSHETSDILANVVLCGFAGLRQSEFERLTWEQVKIERGVIDLSATMTKTAKRRFVTIRPALLAWLQHLGPFQSGPICKTNFSNRLKAFRWQLNTQWKPNVLRHSFASYMVETTANPGEVSLQLGHGNAGVLYAHYRALVSADDAKAFWALTPAAVLRGGEVIDATDKVKAS
jgi:site-specific recombinase XerD